MTQMSAAKGLEGVVAAATEMSFIDGAKGVLEYVGIAIDDLARNSSFEETVFLLWNRRLPNQSELDAFTKDLRSNYELTAETQERRIQNDARLKLRSQVHVLRTLVSALSLEDPEPNSVDLDEVRDEIGFGPSGTRPRAMVAGV